MPIWKPNSKSLDLKKALLQRCDDIIDVASKRSIEHQTKANIWGKVHISLGITTIVFSSLSAILTFYDKQIIIAISSLFSTILASCLTFLNPANRESKRRNSSHKFWVLTSKAEQAKLLINTRVMSEGNMIELTEELTKELSLLLKELVDNT